MSRPASESGGDVLLCYTGAQKNTMPSKVERKFDRGGDGDLLLGPQQGLSAREGRRHRERRGRVGREGGREQARCIGLY